MLQTKIQPRDDDDKDGDVDDVGYDDGDVGDDGDVNDNYWLKGGGTFHSAGQSKN